MMPEGDKIGGTSHTNSQRQSVQWVGRCCCAAGYDGRATGPTAWNRCRLLSGNGITRIPDSFSDKVWDSQSSSLRKIFSDVTSGAVSGRNSPIDKPRVASPPAGHCVCGAATQNWRRKQPKQFPKRWCQPPRPSNSVSRAETSAGRAACSTLQSTAAAR